MATDYVEEEQPYAHQTVNPITRSDASEEDT